MFETNNIDIFSCRIVTESRQGMSEIEKRPFLLQHFQTHPFADTGNIKSPLFLRFNIV